MTVSHDAICPVLIQEVETYSTQILINADLLMWRKSILLA